MAFAHGHSPRISVRKRKQEKSLARKHTARAIEHHGWSPAPPPPAAAGAILLPQRGSAEEGKVSLELYYESLCPYCSRFIVNHLAGILEDGLIDAVHLRLVPYGNARVGSNSEISCQVLKFYITSSNHRKTVNESLNYCSGLSSVCFVCLGCV